MDVTVCLPARDEAESIGAMLAVLVPMRERGVVARVVVLDDGSTDDTAAIARAAGAEVVAAGSLMPEQGPTRGKGDVVWRSQAVLETEVVVYLDADLDEISERYVLDLVAPLADPAVQLVKGAFERPLTGEGLPKPYGGGRVTELLARPLLRAFYPELADVVQPLSGQIAVRRAWLARLPVWSGYGLEIGVLLDTLALGGREAIAQADLGLLLNRHQPLAALGQMADDVLATVLAALEREGRLPAGAAVAAGDAPIELPPFAGVHAEHAA